jgi:folate-dependent tRNA-U54 methylase TrmFO/GidA
MGKFTPMNVNFGIIAPPEKRIRGGKAAKNKYLSARSLAELDQQFLTF